jgi:hypothetical protein
LGLCLCRVINFDTAQNILRKFSLDGSNYFSISKNNFLDKTVDKTNLEKNAKKFTYLIDDQTYCCCLKKRKKQIKSVVSSLDKEEFVKQLEDKNKKENNSCNIL